MIASSPYRTIDMKVIGLTGGIGSGKTVVSKIFEILDIPIYNSDYRAKFLMENNLQIKKSLVQYFGELVYLKDDSLDRKYLSNAIFDDVAALHMINSIVHPYVAEDFELWKSKQSGEFIIKESALLIETLKQQAVDKIIVVKASKTLRLLRVKTRDQLSESDILKRMENQLDDEQRILYADYLIDNEGNKSIVQQTITIYKMLKALD